MQEAVKRFVEVCQSNCRNDNSEKSVPHGLTLIDMPTGSGKTYNTIQLIAKYLKGEAFTDVSRIFYLTPLNKNVKDAYEDLRDVLKREGQEDLFNKNCLWLQANFQAVLDNLLEVEDDIPAKLKKEKFYNLRKSITAYKKIDNIEGIGNLSDLKSGLENDIRNNETEFRYDIKRVLSNICHTKAEKERKIRAEWKWLSKLYPGVFIEKKKVIFMNVDKFTSPNDPLISKSFRFINSDFIKGSLVFVDEFDASKEFILRSQIKQCSQNKLDLVKYVSTLSAVFASGNKLPAELFPPSEDDNPKKSSAYACSQLKKRVEECREKCKLDYHFKLINASKDKRCFIFQDNGFHSIFSTKDEPYIRLSTDSKKGVNIIEFTGDDKNGKEFYRMMYRLISVLAFSVRCFSMMARNYLHYFNFKKRGEGDDFMMPEEAVSTVIDPFGLDDKIKSILADMVIRNFNAFNQRKGNRILRDDFYYDGFSYFDFLDDVSHDTTTSISMCSLDDTPERFILSLCSSAMVIGVSATATINTVLGNYNLDYLKRNLGKAFVPVAKEDLARISRVLKQSYSEGRDYKVNVKAIGCEGQESEDFAKEVFQNPDNIDDLSNVLGEFDMRKKNGNGIYDKQRYVRVLLAIQCFLTNPEAKAMLVLTNYNLKSSDHHPFNRATIDKFVQALAKETNLAQPVTIHDLHGNVYEQEKRQYQSDIRNGKRVILFTSYPASGTGQNLQYSLMEGSDEKSEFGKDIDTIYLEKPTNVLVNINLDPSDEDAFLSEPDLVKYIYQVESLRYEGEISLDKSMNLTKKAFKTYMKGERQSVYEWKNAGSEYNTDSVNNSIVRTLEQAVGRICRTRDKNKADVCIYLADEIFGKVDFHILDGKLVTKEFAKIKEKAEPKKESKNSLTTQYLNKGANMSVNLASSINWIVAKNAEAWPPEEMSEWRAIREWVLTHPTCSKVELAEHNEFAPLYFEFPPDVGTGSALYFSETDGRQKLSLTKDSDRSKAVSSLDCFLPQLMKIPCVGTYFGNHGYASSFDKNEMIILPTAYINFYKGALGEAVVKAVLTEYGCRLSEIIDPAKFEKFDFAIPTSPNVYVDAKNWMVDAPDGESSIKHVDDKLTKIGGRKAFIVNLIPARDDDQIKDNGRVCRVPNILKWKGKYLYVDDKKARQLIRLILEAGVNEDGTH